MADHGSSSLRVLVLHGPNLNLLGERDQALYGTVTLAEIEERLHRLGVDKGAAIESRQSNSEGELVSWVQEVAFGAPEQRFSGLVINPGAYSHTSLALLDAVAAVVEHGTPVVEAHLSRVHARDSERRRLLTARAASGVISGLGPISYELALDAVILLARQRNLER